MLYVAGSRSFPSAISATYHPQFAAPIIPIRIFSRDVELLLLWTSQQLRFCIPIIPFHPDVTVSCTQIDAINLLNDIHQRLELPICEQQKSKKRDRDTLPPAMMLRGQSAPGRTMPVIDSRAAAQILPTNNSLVVAFHPFHLPTPDVEAQITTEHNIFYQQSIPYHESFQ